MNYSQKLEFDKIINLIKKDIKTPYAEFLLDNLNPSCDYNEVIRLNNETNEARVISSKYDNLAFLCINDIKDLIEKLKLNITLSQGDILDIFVLLQNTNQSLNYYKEYKDEINFLKPYFNSLDRLDTLYNKLKKTIDEKANILDTASEYLLSIRNNIKNYNNDIKNKLLDIIHAKTVMLSENVIVLRNNRMCLCVKEAYKNQIKGTIHDESSSGSTFYIEPSNVSAIYAKMNHLYIEETDEIKKILKEVSNSIYEVHEELSKNFYTLTNLDVIYAKASYAIKIDAYLPKINNNKEINIIKGRHPLIDPHEIVPINVNLGITHDAIIITGPNTGGKTVVLKTVGLLTLMMQSGILVPLDSESTLSIFENIFVDIGDSQSIEQSLSTFSSHMLNIINIVNNINNKSLVLLDELGSGTDPNEGSLLAISIIDYLIKNDVRMIATTHYANLKSYAYNQDKVINASVEFDIKTLKPTYKLLLGIPGMSNAINISRNLGLKEDILMATQNMSNENTNNSDVLISKLDQKNLELIQKEKEYDLLLRKVELQKQEYEEKLSSITLERNKIINDANLKANEILDKAKTDAKDLINKLDEIKDKEIKQHQIAELKQEASSLKVKKEIKKEIREYSVGENVLIDEYSRCGIIKSIKNNKYFIKIGNLEMSFTAEELSPYKQVEVPKVITKKKVSTPKITKSTGISLDLRGYRYEEVAPAIDKFIDDAYLAGLTQINIIHGFGSGAVRNATQDFLKKSSYVESTRYGGEFEGGNGCTVVYLK